MIKGLVEARQAGTAWLLTSAKETDLSEEVFRFAKNNNLTLITLYKEQSSLEEVFHKLTNS
jgi:hypothetical protein